MRKIQTLTVDVCSVRNTLNDQTQTKYKYAKMTQTMFRNFKTFKIIIIK